jgi:dTMP kinase
MYICFEGCDGTGKSTMCKNTVDLLSQKYPNTETIHAKNPGATTLGQTLRHIIKHDKNIELDSFTERLLFFADNAHFVNSLLMPSLQQGKIVVADRCNFIGDIAYAEAMGNDLNLIYKLHSLLKAPKIDLLFVLWCDRNICRYRTENRNESCKIESRGEEFLRKVNVQYKKLITTNTDQSTYIAQYHKKKVFIDASQSEQNVWASIVKELETEFKTFVEIIDPMSLLR